MVLKTHDACLITADQTSDRDVRIKRELLCCNVSGDFFHIKTQEPVGLLHLVPDGDLRNMADVFPEGDSLSRCRCLTTDRAEMTLQMLES